MTRRGDPTPVLVMGAGAWGTALALSFARAGCAVTLWGRDRVRMQEMAASRENARHLPGLVLPASIGILTTLDELPARRFVTVLATPLQTTREVVTRALACGQRDFVCTAKGIETGTGLLVHEIVAALTRGIGHVALVSGPTFAREVAEERPTALTVASADAAFGHTLVGALHTASLRPYLTDDVAGVAVGGAVKNVLAIAAGIADGLALGANSRAALITRGLAEMARLGGALGGRTETFMGLAGLGDLVLTCTDDQSRNRRFGIALGRGTPKVEAERLTGLVEGVPTAAAVLARAAESGVDMPICRAVERTLRGELTPAAAVHALMTRELRTGS